jgi:ABC-type bacteriocin/lantibiotic exporter with double-glycine peptidase domain
VLPLFPQELPTSCVAACVRMVLADLGHSLSEAEIRHRCGHEAAGMRLGKIASGLKDLPVTVEYHIDWGRDDLIDLVRAGVFPIVALDLRPVEGRDAYHAAVVVDVTSDQMVVHDPLQEKGPRTISRSTSMLRGARQTGRP